MYAIAIIRYTRPLEEVLKVVEQHRAYMRELGERKVVLASGPLDPRHGGALLLRVPDEGADAALRAVRDGDPYVRSHVAQYELLPWVPMQGKDALDRM